MTKDNHASTDTAQDTVRLDKWLWAARFYKTRSLAKTMIEGGKVHYQGQRVKPSKEVQLGAEIRLRQGNDVKTVLVTGISDRRGNASAAALLYRETEDSIAARLVDAEQRQHERKSAPHPDSRPTKKQRRQIIQFQQQEPGQD